MSVEVNVTGTLCGAGEGGLACVYCYQAPVRRGDGNARPVGVDHDAVQKAVLAAGGDGFTVFGGEPLLASLADLERLWAFGLERFGRNGVQTSGRPVTGVHLALFEKYRVHVGFSVDGPGELNDARWAGTATATRAATSQSIGALRSCLARGIACSLIVTLHALNARGDRLGQLLAWFRSLDEVGLRSARLHLLERDGPGAERLALTDEENVAALRACRELERELKVLRFDVFADVEKKLRDPDASATCTWNDCDPWTTTAVHGIEADGSRSLCQRVHKDGVKWAPAAGSSRRVRQLALWRTPQEEGGCAGCRFFLQCGGQCPGTAIGGDWRRRSADCRTWFAILETVEREMVERGERPASLDPDLAARVERRLATALSSGQPAGGHGDRHGDSPHGDAHGDHTDVPGTGRDLPVSGRMEVQ